MKKKADKTDIMRLESEKAEKLYCEGEFKTTYREIESIKNWLGKLEELLKSASGSSNSNISDI
jgi:hypothetical protein